MSKNSSVATEQSGMDVLRMARVNCKRKTSQLMEESE